MLKENRPSTFRDEVKKISKRVIRGGYSLIQTASLIIPLVKGPPTPQFSADTGDNNPKKSQSLKQEQIRSSKKTRNKKSEFTNIRAKQASIKESEDKKASIHSPPDNDDHRTVYQPKDSTIRFDAARDHHRFDIATGAPELVGFDRVDARRDAKKTAAEQKQYIDDQIKGVQLMERLASSIGIDTTDVTGALIATIGMKGVDNLEVVQQAQQYITERIQQDGAHALLNLKPDQIEQIRSTLQWSNWNTLFPELTDVSVRQMTRIKHIGDSLTILLQRGQGLTEDISEAISDLTKQLKDLPPEQKISLAMIVGMYSLSAGLFIDGVIHKDKKKQLAALAPLLFACGTLGNISPTALPDVLATETVVPPTLEPTEAPPTPMPTVEPTPSVFDPNQAIDTSLIDGQEQVVKYGGHGNIYVYDVASGTIITPPGVTLSESDRQTLTSTAQTQITELKRRNEKFDYVAVQTNGVAGDGNRNAATAFVKIGAEWAIQWPSAQIAGKNALSTSPSDWNFIAPVTSKDITYTDILLPANAKPESVLVRWVGENQIVEVTGTDGSQWVMNWQTGEWVTMIDRPTNYEQMKADLFDYATVYHRNVESGQQSLFADPEAIIGRLEEKTGTGKDGTPFKALVDPETNTILFLKTQNQETGEWEWEGATIGSLFLINNLDSIYLLRGYNDKNIEVIDYDGVGISLTTELDVATVFGNFSDSNWEWILSNWEEVQIQINNGELPNLPYNWTRGDNAIREINSDFTNPQITGSQLLEYGVGNEAIRNFSKNNNLSEDQMLKLFEFIIRSRVINYPEITNWHVSDEIATGFVSELPENRFWSEATGLTPAELVIKVGEWVKKDNPNAKTMIVEDNIFDFSNPNARWTRDYFYNTFIKQVIAMNQSGVIDGVVGENNWWIYEPQKWDLIEKQITFLQSNGLEILGAETMIVMGDEPINHDPSVRRKLTQLDNPELAQADMYAEWLRLMLKLGINEVGFGSMGADDEAWTNDVGLPDANPQFLDDNLKPKLAYFAMLRVLSENLTNH